ncbi:MAG: aldo/keto reductase [Candidatus Bruticola sp.]
MEKRLIGSLSVSEIGMGCMGFSNGYGPVPEEEYAINAIRKAFEFGCNFFDTAEIYGQAMLHFGHNEELVGKAIAPFRNNVVLATKLMVSPEEVAEGRSVLQAVKKHLEASLRRLGTDYVDLYYLHRINEEVSFEAVAEAMGQLIKEGLIREWGLSQVSAEILDQVHQITPVGAVQNIYSMLERSCEEKIFPYCLKNNICIVPFSPIANGFLSGRITVDTKFFDQDDFRKIVPQLTKENIAANQPILDVLDKFAQSKQATKAQISLAWMLHKYPNVVPIPGSRNLERILENLGASSIKLTNSEFDQLEEALNKCQVHGHRGHSETLQHSLSSKWIQNQK